MLATRPARRRLFRAPEVKNEVSISLPAYWGPEQVAEFDRRFRDWALRTAAEIDVPKVLS